VTERIAVELCHGALDSTNDHTWQSGTLRPAHGAVGLSVVRASIAARQVQTWLPNGNSVTLAAVRGDEAMVVDIPE
jgi:hypothetical protein